MPDNTCSECKFSKFPEDVNQGQCYFNPPQVQGIQTMDTLQRPQIAIMSFRPQVNMNDDACGQFDKAVKLQSV